MSLKEHFNGVGNCLLVPKNFPRHCLICYDYAKVASVHFSFGQEQELCHIAIQVPMVQGASAKMCMFVLGLKGRQHATDQFRLKHIMHLFLSGILTIANAKKN